MSLIDVRTVSCRIKKGESLNLTVNETAGQEEINRSSALTEDGTIDVVLDVSHPHLPFKVVVTNRLGETKELSNDDFKTDVCRRISLQE